MVKSIQLTLYLEEDATFKTHLLYEWILELAKNLKLPGCSCFRCFMSYGKDQQIHSEAFFELQGKNTVVVIFILSKEQMITLLNKLKENKITCFYTQFEVESGIL